MCSQTLYSFYFVDSLQFKTCNSGSGAFNPQVFLSSLTSGQSEKCYVFWLWAWACLKACWELRLDLLCPVFQVLKWKGLSESLASTLDGLSVLFLWQLSCSLCHWYIWTSSEMDRSFRCETYLQFKTRAMRVFCLSFVWTNFALFCNVGWGWSVNFETEWKKPLCGCIWAWSHTFSFRAQLHDEVINYF